jgi:hypothetical protein
LPSAARISLPGVIVAITARLIDEERLCVIFSQVQQCLLQCVAILLIVKPPSKQFVMKADPVSRAGAFLSQPPRNPTHRCFCTA